MRTISRAIRQRARVAIAIALAHACLLHPSGGSAATVEHYKGEAYASDGRAVYQESHWLRPDAGVEDHLVLYLCPDGKPFARKRVRGSSGDPAPDFDLIDGRSGYLESVRSKGTSREISVRSSTDAKLRTAILPAAAHLVVDSGFDAFVQAQWGYLEDGSMTLSFVVPSRLQAMRFEVRRIGEETIDHRAVVRFRLELASWYGGLLPHVDVLYDAKTHVLRRYEGVSNLRDADAKNIRVRIEFPLAERNRVDIADLERATAVALSGTCRLS